MEEKEGLFYTCVFIDIKLILEPREDSRGLIGKYFLHCGEYFSSL